MCLSALSNYYDCSHIENCLNKQYRWFIKQYFKYDNNRRRLLYTKNTNYMNFSVEVLKQSEIYWIKQKQKNVEKSLGHGQLRKLNP